MSIDKRIRYLGRLYDEMTDFGSEIDPFCDKESYDASCTEYRRMKSLFIDLYECIEKRDPSNPIINKYREEYHDLFELGFPPTWENRMDYAM